MALTTPRWRTAIEKALSKHKNQNVLQVATLDSSRLDGPFPRVRSQIFREFLDYPTNPNLFLLISTTDIRTPKVEQITADPKAEVVWWIEGTIQQFRILSDVYIVPTPTNPLHSHFIKALQKAQSDSALAQFKDEDWEARRVAVFKTMSPRMKASWCRPIPGSPLKGGEEEARKWPERVEEPDKNSPKEKYEEAKRNWDMALNNFALFLIDPIEVDFVDLQTPPDKRHIFVKVQDTNGVVWDQREVVP